ncbi:MULTISPECIES: hypothetical protein [Clostridium]|uniref:Uncharacterized protein n=1 Tax=Clostridium ragsdalei P11 TaxID=1353534 RepID=A0A1A6AP93_9CLOT|nr:MULTISPECIES: hypothetical protein [Clostridium]AZV55354.1 hypothetical protein DMR38_01340 [Clostridium sp. AWRP]OBR91865.1 hypothetical protein CLRAG_28500 [Clostridium ragsdalei P11]QXE19585.1 hypothetical protein B5S50_12555 [Clostridium sp. 001]
MSHRKIIEDYYCDVNNLAELLSKLTNSYRLLIGGAGELNSIAGVHKGEVKDSLKRVYKLGNVIDKVVDTLKDSTEVYSEYCKLTTEVIKEKMQIKYVETEIDEELFLNNLDDMDEDDDTKGD